MGSPSISGISRFVSEEGGRKMRTWNRTDTLLLVFCFIVFGGYSILTIVAFVGSKDLIYKVGWTFCAVLSGLTSTGWFVRFKSTHKSR